MDLSARQRFTDIGIWSRDSRRIRNGDREKNKDSFVYPNPTNFGSVTVNVDRGYNNTDAFVTIHDETGLILSWATVTVKGNRFVLDAFQTLPEGSHVLIIQSSDGFRWGGWVYNRSAQ